MTSHWRAIMVALLSSAYLLQRTTFHTSEFVVFLGKWEYEGPSECSDVTCNPCVMVALQLFFCLCVCLRLICAASLLHGTSVELMETLGSKKQASLRQSVFFPLYLFIYLFPYLFVVFTLQALVERCIRGDHEHNAQICEIQKA